MLQALWTVKESFFSLPRLRRLQQNIIRLFELLAGGQVAHTHQMSAYERGVEGSSPPSADLTGVSQAPNSALYTNPTVSFGNRIEKTAPRPGPSENASARPPWSSAIRLTMERPSPVEPSPPVGLAERRW